MERIYAFSGDLAEIFNPSSQSSVSVGDPFMGSLYYSFEGTVPAHSESEDYGTLDIYEISEQDSHSISFSVYYKDFFVCLLGQARWLDIYKDNDNHVFKVQIRAQSARTNRVIFHEALCFDPQVSFENPDPDMVVGTSPADIDFSVFTTGSVILNFWVDTGYTSDTQLKGNIDSIGICTNFYSEGPPSAPSGLRVK